MAKYQIKSPDGQTFEITAPDDATQEQVLAYAQQNAPARQAQPEAVTESLPRQYMGGFAQGLGFEQNMRGAPGAVERWTAGIGRGARDVIDTGSNAWNWLLHDKLGVASDQAAQNYERARDADRAEYAARYGDDVLSLGGAGRIVGQLGTATPLVRGVGLAAQGVSKAAPIFSNAISFLSGRGGNLASRAAGSSAQGAGYAAATSSIADDPASYIAQGTVLGGAVPIVAAGARGLGNAVGRGLANDLTPEAARLAQRADALGIPLNAAQITNNPSLRLLDSVTRKVPLSGARTELGNQQQAFNRAVSRTFGENADNVTPDVYSTAKGRLGAEFERLSSQNSIPLDAELMTGLKGIAEDAAKFGSDDTARAVRSYIEELTGKTQSGVIAGKTYQALDSKLGQLMKAGGEKAHYLGQLRDLMRSKMDDAISPADKAAWQTAREQYRALKTVRDLITKDAADGNISPARLMERVAASNAGKEAVASGRGGQLAEIATIGQRFLKDTVPNSGTAERASMLAGLGAGAGGVVAPATTASLLLSSNLARRAMNNDAVKQTLLRRALNGNTAAPTPKNTLVQRLAPNGAPVYSPGVILVANALLNSK